MKGKKGETKGAMEKEKRKERAGETKEETDIEKSLRGWEGCSQRHLWKTKLSGVEATPAAHFVYSSSGNVVQRQETTAHGDMTTYDLQ